MTTFNFEDSPSSERQKAYNAMLPKSKPREILGFVENTHDVDFWSNILSHNEEENHINFRLSAYSGNDATTGKEKLKKLFPNTGDYMIICLDSDYDYLLANNSEMAKAINHSPYILQTYAYAMENLKCYAPHLNKLCVRATCNSLDDIIDFSGFIKEYSKIIYPLLIWSLYFESIQQPPFFSRDDFKKITTIGNINPDNYKELLEKLEKTIAEKIKEFANNVDIFNFSQQFSELTTENSYLFSNGHAIYPTVLNLFKQTCITLKKNHNKKIKSLAENQKQSDDEKNYKKIPSDFETILDKNDKFTDCFLFQKIKSDIENYIALFKQNTQGLNHV